MDESQLKIEILKLERLKLKQYSSVTVEKMEQDIINLINEHLKENDEYAAMDTEHERLCALVDSYNTLIECTLALDKATAASGAAGGAHIADFITPGEFGTIASAEVGKIKENKQRVATALFDKLNADNRFGKHFGDISMSEMLRTMDMFFDAFRKKGLDITSIANSYNSFMEAGDYKNATLRLKEVTLKIKNPGLLVQQIDDLENKAEMKIQSLRNRLTAGGI